MKLYVPPLRKLINYFQGKQVENYLGNTFVDMVGEKSRRVIQNIKTHNQKDQIENLAFLSLLNGAYQKNPHLFVRPKKPSTLQKIMFGVSNKLDKIVA